MKNKTVKRVKKVRSFNHYDSFVRQARNASFTDMQLDFLWDWFVLALLDKQIFLHKDNYSNKAPRGKKK